jgi:hypothetical protein
VSRADLWRLVRAGAVAAVVAVVLLSPVLYAVTVRVADGQWESSRVFWRSSPPGVDALAFVLPNPNHPLASQSIRDWLSRPRADAYLENVASLTFVALMTILVAWRTGWRPQRFWAGTAVFFSALALGPFIHVAGINTYIPGPWAVLRYVPVIGLARTPARFSIVLVLGVAVLFASALT